MNRIVIATVVAVFIIIMVPGPASASYYTNEEYVCQARVSYAFTYDPVAKVARASFVLEGSSGSFGSKVQLTIYAAETHPNPSANEVFEVDHAETRWLEGFIYYEPTNAGYMSIIIESTGFCGPSFGLPYFYDIYADQWYYDYYESTLPPCFGVVCGT